MKTSTVQFMRGINWSFTRHQNFVSFFWKTTNLKGFFSHLVENTTQDRDIIHRIQYVRNTININVKGTDDVIIKLPMSFVISGWFKPEKKKSRSLHDRRELLMHKCYLTWRFTETITIPPIRGNHVSSLRSRPAFWLDIQSKQSSWSGFHAVCVKKGNYRISSLLSWTLV